MLKRHIFVCDIKRLQCKHMSKNYESCPSGDKIQIKILISNRQIVIMRLIISELICRTIKKTPKT